MAGSIPISEDSLQTATSVLPAGQLNAAEQDLWIFRDGRVEVSGPAMLRDLSSRISGRLQGSALLDVLIQAGEFEAALADTGHPGSIAAARLTDALACNLRGVPEDCTELSSLLNPVTEVPERISVAPPEGFTYYALHPSDFCSVLSRIPLAARTYAVIGIRSIGTTLSAVLVASLRAQGSGATRITVRPTGHPYARRTDFSIEDLRWIASRNNMGAEFLVVDEGPGRSGSTFLSVAEALQRAGVPNERITIVGSRQPDVHSLCADDAVRRWQSFRFVSTMPSVNTRFENCLYAGNGEWRGAFSLDTWPESWTQMERLKFISPDWKSIYKFEGMGRLGKTARDRALVLADSGYGPDAQDADDGFVAYALLAGWRLRPADERREVLDRVTEYCAFRESEFAAPTPQPQELTDMLRFNVQQEFGKNVEMASDALVSNRTVIADGRMQPFEWIASSPDRLIKTDGVDHGDNHFFPGPCDITWDIAGFATEWQLSPTAIDHVLERFRSKTGRDLSAKFALYMLAYCVFRLGFCKMAISTVKGTPEELRLEEAYLRYRQRAWQLLQAHRYCFL